MQEMADTDSLDCTMGRRNRSAEGFVVKNESNVNYQYQASGFVLKRLPDTLLRFLTVLLLVLTQCGVQCARTSEEYLLKHLFEGYNPLARPVLNSSETVSVNLRFSLLQIQELNVRSQVLTTTGLLILDWVDERLSWDDTISDLDEIVVHGGNIWRPEFAVINGAESIYGDYQEFQAVLRRDGTVRWEPGGVFKTMCPIDITFYPFDEQTCHLVFGAWSYYTTKMNLTTDRPEGIHLHSYETNGEWEIIGTGVQRNEFHFECCPDERFSNINFTVALRRRPEFYVMNVILPGVLISAVLLCIFYCIPSQKVHIGSAALLSIRLFLLNVVDTVPRTSDHVPLLGIYLTSTMTITTLSIVATVFVGNLYEMKDHPVPNWAHSALLYYAARLLGLCTRCVDEPHPPSSPTYTTLEHCNAIGSDSGCVDHGDPSLVENGARARKTWQRQPSYRLVTLLENPRCSPRRSSHVVETTFNVVEDSGSVRDDVTDTSRECNPQAARAADRREVFSAETAWNGADVDGVAKKGTVTVLTRNEGSISTDPRSQIVKTAPPCFKRFSKDWANVAAVCDRLFFWLCFVLTVISTLWLFHPLIWLQHDSILVA